MAVARTVTAAQRKAADEAALEMAALVAAMRQVTGLVPGDTVRFRPYPGGSWVTGKARCLERDGSVGITDSKGGARCIPADRVEVRWRGPRGGYSWVALT